MQKDLKTIFGDHHGLDEKSTNFLINALEKANLPGFDYIEFKQSLAALMAMNMEESMAFKSAFATAATVGLTKEKLLQTADHYRKVLNKEKEQFESAMNKQIDQRVGGKLTEVKKLKAQIEKHKEKIAQLQEQINKFQATVDGADEQIKTERSKIESTREGFEHTHQSIMNQIDVDMGNIQKYL